MYRIAVLLSLALGAGALATTAQAASFNCAKAKTPSEKAICAKPTLSDLDQRMGDKYKILIKMLGKGSAQASQIRAEQVWFLGRRDACGAEEFCLRGQIADRIVDLEGYIAQATRANAG